MNPVNEAAARILNPTRNHPFTTVRLADHAPKPRPHEEHPVAGAESGVRGRTPDSAPDPGSGAESTPI